MNVYDKNYNNFLDNISESTTDLFHEKVKEEFENYIKLNPSHQNIIKELISIIKSPYELFNQCYEVQRKFLNLPNENHAVFAPFIENFKDFNFKLNEINKVINTGQIENEHYYIKSHKKFISDFVNREEKTMDIFSEPPVLIDEQSKFYQIKSLKLAHEMASYDPDEYDYKKNNSTGLSYGSVVGKVFYKNDKNAGLLKPAREHAVFEIYKLILPFSSTSFVSPTGLIGIDQLKILPPDVISDKPSNGQLSIRKQLGNLKTKFNTYSVKELLNREPLFRRDLNNALKECPPIFIQASSFINGTRFDNYLEYCEQLKDSSQNPDTIYKEIDMESYSSHVIISLLVNHKDYKPDNLILEDGTNRIIGIDNDDCLESDEVEMMGANENICIKNILFAIKPLMKEPINKNVKNQFISHNSALIVLKWLLAIEAKQLNTYDTLLSKLYDYLSKKNNSTIDQIEKPSSINFYKGTLNMPMEFKRRWIIKMVERFDKIKRILINNQNATHQDLFNAIYPFSSEVYEALSNKKDKPFDVLDSIYKEKSVSNIEELCNIKLERYYQVSNMESISLRNTIIEIIQQTTFNDLLECSKNSCGSNCIENCKSREIVIEWLELVFSYINDKNYSEEEGEKIHFHRSWYENKKSIFLSLLKFGSTIYILKNIVRKLNIVKSTIISDFYQRDIIVGQFIFDQIEFLIKEFKIDVDHIQNGNTLLNLSISFNNFELFFKLIGLGAGKNTDPLLINRYYSNLSYRKKSLLRPYLEKLFLINPKAAWLIALNQLFPISNNNNNNNRKIKELGIGGNYREISDDQWSQLFDAQGKPKKLNEYGTRTVTLVEDKYGNGIYLKFKPQFPGTEYAVMNLSELLFGTDSNLISYCELVSINDIPVLLIQKVPGAPLVDVLEKNPSAIREIEQSNLSKQLILSMLINDGDGNLGNFIVSPKNINGEYKIYSIDNDQSFMPPISIGTILNQLGSKALQVDSALLLFDQMNENVHHDVIERFRVFNVNKVLSSWLVDLDIYHKKSLDSFQAIKDKLKVDKETIIGVSFTDGMISHLCSKLQRLQHLLRKERSANFTHFDLLEVLEPSIANRYKPIIDSTKSIITRYSKIKNIAVASKNELSCSIHNSIHSSLSRIPNVHDIQEQLWSGRYGPSQAINELTLIQNQNQNLKDIINLLERELRQQNLFQSFMGESIVKKYIISNYQLECLIKADYNNISDPNGTLINLIVSKQLSIVNLKNNPLIDIYKVRQLPIASLVKLDLSGCNGLISLDFMMGRLNFNLLTTLKLNNCSKLQTIRIYAPKLKVLNAINCKFLKYFDLEAPNLLLLNLKNSISKQCISISKLLERLINLESLDISNTNYTEITINLKNLKYLNIHSMDYLKKVKFEVPSIKTINFENCKQLKEINTLKNDYYLNRNLFLILNNQRNKSTIKESKILVNLMLSKEIDLEFFQKNVQSITSCAILFYEDYFLPFGQFNYEYFYKWDSNLSILNSPYIKTLLLCNGFRVELFPDIFSKNLDFLYLGNSLNRLELLSFLPTIKQIHLSEFNQSINEKTLPSNLKTLSLDRIDQPIVSLSNKLNQINICDSFNQPINENTLPKSLKKIKIFSNNQTISIPNHLQLIELYNNSYQNIKFPYTVNDLVIGTLARQFNIEEFSKDYPKLIVCYFGKPRYLFPNEKEKIYSNFNLNDLRELFKLKSIDIGSSILYWNKPTNDNNLKIPNEIQNLYLGHFDCQIKELIPKNITNLELCDGFNLNFNSNFIIPPNVTSLGIGDIKHQIKNGSIPPSVTSLYLHDGFNQTLIPGLIPSTVTNLYIGNIKYPLKVGSIPSTIKTLTFGDRFNKPINIGLLPNSVETLVFGCDFNQPLIPGSLPQKLKNITFGDRFCQSIGPKVLPDTVKPVFGTDYYINFRYQFNIGGSSS